MTTMGQQGCTLTMMATTAMAETATEAAMATAMMPPLPSTATMSMRTTAVIQGRQLDDGNLMMTMGNGDGDGNDAAAAANGNDVDEYDSGNLRTTIG
jgi:hypothetical protein